MALIDVIKYDGGKDVFAWKYPNDELKLGTQVIVNESQEVVLFKNGKALDKLGPGRHTLDTDIIPLLRKIINIPSGGQSPFKAELWYINKTHSLTVKWGTPTPIQIQDPQYKILVPVRAFGQFGITIDDSKKFLTKLVGTAHDFNSDTIKDYFRGVYVTKVKDTISQYIVKKKISILQINAYLNELSDFIKEKTQNDFDKYGILLINFYVNDINVPEDDPALIKLKEALAKRAEMDVVGYDYKQERSFDTLQKAAEGGGNSVKNDVMGASLGVGMGAGIGGNMGEMFRKMTDDLFNFGENSHFAKQDTSARPIVALGVNANGKEERTDDIHQDTADSDATEQLFAKVIGRPLSSAKIILEQLGFLDKESVEWDSLSADKRYTFKYITDDGKSVLNPANWIVNGLEADDETHTLYIGLTRKERKK